MQKDIFSSASKGNNKLWIYGLGILTIFFGYSLGQLPLFLIARLAISKNPDFGVEDFDKFNNEMDFSVIGIHSNMGFLLLLLMFVFAFFGLMIMLRAQGKNVIDLITPNKNINFRKILFGFTAWMVIGIVLEFLVYLMNPSGYTFEFKPLSFLVLFLISILILPIQSSFEEFFFRGYIMQGAVNFYPYKWFGLLVSTLFFAFVHGANPEVSEYGATPMMIYYIIAGLFLGVITIIDNSLELALGVHWATNLFGALFLSYKGSVLQTDSLFKSDLVNPWVMSAFFVVAAVVFIYICWKRYNWSFTSLGEVFGKVELMDTLNVVVESTRIREDFDIELGINYKSIFNNGTDDDEKEENS